MKKSVLISGISGQDGSYLAQLLLNKGYVVFGTSRDALRAYLGNLHYLGIRDMVKIVSMDLSDLPTVQGVLAHIQPQEIYHLAGQSSVALSFEQPAEAFKGIALGTLNILEAIRLSGRFMKFFNACSSECFGDTTGSVAVESSPFQPRSPYAAAKASAFWEVASYREAFGMYGCSAILSNHESPLRSERFVTKKIVAAAVRIANGSKEKLHLGDLSIRRDWGWAPEYVEAMWLMMQQAQPEDFIVSTGESHCLEEYVAATFSFLGMNWRDHVVVDKRLFRPSEISVVQVDPTKARKKLFWEARIKINQIIDLMVRTEQAAQNKTVR